MRDVDERQRHQQVESSQLEAPVQNKVPTAEDHQTRFSSQGPYPEVADAKTEAIAKPTASERAYDETRPDAPETWPTLLRDFYTEFPEAARLIAKQPSSCKFVQECEAKGAKFGGYAENGPGKEAWAHTSGDTVFIPASHTDPFVAMSDFLFELNNAVRNNQFAALDAEAFKGSKGTLDAKSYAHNKVELEVEGMLRTGEVWLAAKKEAGKEHDKAWSERDQKFYVQEYEAFRDGKLTKEDIVQRVLLRKYPEGKYAGKTTEEFYMDEYKGHADVKISKDHPELMQP